MLKKGSFELEADKSRSKPDPPFTFTNKFHTYSMFLSNKFLQGPSNRSNACTSKQPHFTGPLACILAARGLFVKKASSPKNFPLSKVTKWTDFSGSDLSSPFLVISTSPLTTM